MQFALLFLAIGLLLLCVEVCIPGFGIPGILGLCSLTVGASIISRSYGTFAMIMTLIFILVIIVILIKLIRKNKIINSVILENFEGVKDFDESSIMHLMGKDGITITSLRPIGKADFDGFITEVKSAGEFIEKGKKVKVIQISGKTIVVKEVIEEVI